MAISWCFRDEITPVTQRLLNEGSSSVMLVPSWWHVEIANVLALAERKRRVGFQEIDDSAAGTCRAIGLEAGGGWLLVNRGIALSLSN